MDKNEIALSSKITSFMKRIMNDEHESGACFTKFEKEMKFC